MHMGSGLATSCTLLLIFIHLATFTTLLPSCPLECLCLSQTQVLCNSGGLREIPLKLLPPTVEHLSLTRNHFPVIKSDSFAGLRYLKKLSLDGNNISLIKPFAFRWPNPTLIILLLPLTVAHLSLNKNHFPITKSDPFASLHYLKKLSLDGSDILLNKPFAFRGLPRLRDLSIQYTPLETVSPFAFAGLQNITSIYLSYNKIKKVESYAFAGTVNLKLLVLTHNPLIKLESHAFTGMTEIDRIVLPSGIRTLEPDCFNGMDTLGHLQLAFMDLRELKRGIFRGLTNVNYLSIQESDLGNVEGDAFDEMTFVKTLNILNNKIDSIQWLNFTWEQHIGHLRFQGNHILEIPRAETLLIEVERLTVISNHFPCDCHIHSLLDGPLANGSMIHFISRNYCISPLEVNGMPMSNIDIDSIGRCQEEVTRGNLEASKDSTSSSERLTSFCSYLNLMLYFLKLLRIT